MFVESIKFKREPDSDWERGYYVGDTDNSSKSILLDEDYTPLECDEFGHTVWDYKPDTENWIQFRAND